jgi:hypothetical protein
MFKLIERVVGDMNKPEEAYDFPRSGADSENQPVKTSRLTAAFVSEQTHLTRLSPEKQVDLNSHHLIKYFVDNKINPMEKYGDLYSVENPRILLTVDWTTSFSDIRGCLNEKNMVKQRKHPTSQVRHTLWRMFCLGVCCYPSLLPKDIDSCPLWVDILFNNNLTKLEERLEKTQRICWSAEFHIAIASERLMTRAQCLFEIGTRLSYGKRATIIHNWSKNPVCLMSISSYFWHMKGSDDDNDPFKPVKKIQDTIMSVWHPDGATELEQSSVAERFDKDLFWFVRESNDLNSPTSIPSRLCEWLGLWIFAPFVFIFIIVHFVCGYYKNCFSAAPSPETTAAMR